MGLTLGTDHRQMTDWLAQGQYALGILLSPPEIGNAAAQGLPVGLISGEQFREGALITPGGAAVNLADRAPHPNAARVYINWLLSREGQLAWQQGAQEPSLRIDVPKEGLDPQIVPKPGVKYIDGGAEEHQRTTPGALIELISRALEKAPR
jgi:ABC-type Fe3+ transport system substrate-binding protein